MKVIITDNGMLYKELSEDKWFNSFHMDYYIDKSGKYKVTSKIMDEVENSYFILVEQIFYLD